MRVFKYLHSKNVSSFPEFYQALTGGEYPDDCDNQYDFSRLLERRILRWEISLESIHPVAQQPYFPGQREIEDCLVFIKTISEKRDAFSLITVFRENKKQLLKLAEVAFDVFWEDIDP